MDGADMTKHRTQQPAGATRRQLMMAAGSFTVGCALPAVVVGPATATPPELQSAVAQVIGSAQLNTGKVKLEIPPLVENGNTVPCAVTVESPMTATDYVRAIHVFNEKNPQPNVISVRLGPRAGRASISTRMRLSETQTVLAIAELSDGTFWSDRAHVIITLGACLEDLI
jgi:sulfur-oxidizing protein SoxY